MFLLYFTIKPLRSKLFKTIRHGSRLVSPANVLNGNLSQELREATQAEVSVNQFLMENDLNLSLVNLPETSVRMSPTKKTRVLYWDSD